MLQPKRCPKFDDWKAIDAYTVSIWGLFVLPFAHAIVHWILVLIYSWFTTMQLQLRSWFAPSYLRPWCYYMASDSFALQHGVVWLFPVAYCR